MEKGTSFGLCHLCVLLTLFMAMFPCSQGNWMWLGVTSFGVPEKLGCSNLPLSARQKDMCKKKPYLLSSIREGARLGIQECRNQFKHERWNCSIAPAIYTSSSSMSLSFLSSSLASAQSIFGYELTSGTKETAFISAVTAAGLVHSVTRSCSAGNMTECSCDTSLQNGGSASEGWHWGGCSDDLQYGMWFSRKFLDAPYKNSSESDILSAMHLHNNEAGRMGTFPSMLPYIVRVLIERVFGRAVIALPVEFRPRSLLKEVTLHPMTLANFFDQKGLKPYENLSYLYRARNIFNLKLSETINSKVEIEDSNHPLTLLDFRTNVSKAVKMIRKSLDVRAALEGIPPAVPLYCTAPGGVV